MMRCRISDEIYMDLAIRSAWRSQTMALPNPSVGALVSLGDRVLSLRVHERVGLPHAEVLALKDAFLFMRRGGAVCDRLRGLDKSEDICDFLACNHDGLFRDCNVFVTLEPCNHYGKTPPCALLLQDLAPGRVVIATRDPSGNACGSMDRLAKCDVTYGVSEGRANDLLYPFLRYHEYGSFNLFKLAHRLSGDYKNGFISNDTSRVITHNIRSVADNIVISGETLRNDDPLLDTRFKSALYGDNLPKVYVVTRSISSTHGFNIHGRDVILSCPEDLNPSGFSLIEGGLAFLDMMSRYIRIDLVLGYISPSFCCGSSSICTLQGDFLHSDVIHDSVSNNIMYWFRPNE